MSSRHNPHVLNVLNGKGYWIFLLESVKFQSREIIPPNQDSLKPGTPVQEKPVEMRHLLILSLGSNDGTVNWTLAGGNVPGALAETDGDPTSGFAARDEYITDPSELGPLLDGEYYTYAPDVWGSENTHTTVAGDSTVAAQFVDDLDYVLGANNSISLYVRHKSSSHLPLRSC